MYYSIGPLLLTWIKDFLPACTYKGTDMTPNTIHQSPCKHPDWQIHWEKVYSERKQTDVSWYQSHPEYSLGLIEETGTGIDAEIIDVGGGASTLIDHLLLAGYRHVTVLDIARTAIEQARIRLGDRAGNVTWTECNITDYRPDHQFDIWHDRSVFHFLTNTADRACYIDVLNKTLKPDGHVIIATFSENGPSQCSGLDTVPYSPEHLGQVLGNNFCLIETLTEEHHTPSGGVQQFVYCRFSRNNGA